MESADCLINVSRKFFVIKLWYHLLAAEVVECRFKKSSRGNARGSR